MARSYSDRDLKLLFGKSGMYCAFPGCPNRLVAPDTAVDDEAVLGYIAHIVAHSDVGPRSDPSLPTKERDKYPNLLLLCGHHHRLVDEQDNTYTCEDLRGWKASLEAWVDERLTEGMSGIHFAELEVVCRGLTGGEMLPSTGMSAVPPQKKMSHNDLTKVSAYRMTLGLMQAPQVAAYLQEMATRVDPGFPQRLRRGFVSGYEQFVAQGLHGDALFFAMEDFAYTAAIADDASSSQRFELRAAALAVLCHLFEVCDVFEEPSDVAS